MVLLTDSFFAYSLVSSLTAILQQCSLPCDLSLRSLSQCFSFKHIYPRCYSLTLHTSSVKIVLSSIFLFWMNQNNLQWHLWLLLSTVATKLSPKNRDPSTLLKPVFDLHSISHSWVAWKHKHQTAFLKVFYSSVLFVLTPKTSGVQLFCIKYTTFGIHAPINWTRISQNQEKLP